LDNAYVSALAALAALAGSAIGAIASFATTWLTQHGQVRAQRVALAIDRREHLYGEFLDEASRLFTDALSHEFDDPSKFVRLYALTAKLRLLASANVVSKAEEVMRRILEIYDRPNIDFRKPDSRRISHEVDLLRAFSEACREDLYV
jgi:hypothetical protein